MAGGMLSTRQEEVLLRYAILALTCLLGFSVRLFSVLRYESIIHEFDPWFNYRSTRMLVDRGSYDFWNWFDDRSWYPLGRIVGGTVYPGIMYTAALVHWLLNYLGFAVDIREVCVLTAPIFSGVTAIAAYLLTAQVADHAAGLMAAASMVLVPGYMSRSVAGSYDNEAVAITALLTTFYVFVKAVATGSVLWAALSALAYLYMVASWGGYIFVTNVVPIYTLVMLLSGRFTPRLYVAYSCWYVLGTLLSMQIRFVGFNAVQSSEHMGALGVFALLQLVTLSDFVRHIAGAANTRTLRRMLLLCALGAAAAFAFIGVVSGFIGPWTGRFYTLLDPTYAAKHIPIIASVSEHQPTSWASYYMDLHIFTFLLPVGVYLLFREVRDSAVFLIVYATAAVYFSGVMVRLMLVLAPAAVMLGSVALSDLLRAYMAQLRTTSIADAAAALASASTSGVSADAAAAAAVEAASGASDGGGGGGGGSSSSGISSAAGSRRSTGKKARGAASASSPTTAPSFLPRSLLASQRPLRKEISAVVLLLIFVALVMYVRHSVWTTSEAYSSPSVVLSTRDNAGNRIFFDDFREAYYWLWQNTDEDAKILSWWDYGYQIAGMANRTTIVDNNTWNNTHIATVGRVLNSPEKKAYTICRKLDVDYVLIVFGGVLGYSSDDINKFLWPVRISHSVDPSVDESQYLTSQGGYTVSADMGPAMKKSLMYKLSYYRFGELTSSTMHPGGFDRARNVEIGHKDIKLRYFEEAYTTQHWIVRIYRVKPPNSRGFD